jgi:Protein of unknown function (DUF1269)
LCNSGSDICHFILEKEAGFFAKRIRAEGPDSIPVEFSHCRCRGGAAGGALGGAIADAGINDRFMKDVAQTLQSGNAALFLMIRKMTSAHTDWQVIRTVDYMLNPSLSLRLGYRSLNFDYSASDSPLSFNVHMKGPILAATFQF